MQFKQGVVLAALKRAKLFVLKYARELGDFATSPTIGRLDELIRDFDANDSAQLGSFKQSKAATESKGELRERLRLQHMVPIAATAHAKLAGIPAPKMAKFDVPLSGVSDVTLLAAGRAMVQVAKEYEQVFKDEKFAPDFLEQLARAVGDLQESILARDGDRMERRRATLSLSGQVLLARQVVAMVNGFVLKVFGGKPHIVGEWKSATRLGSQVKSRRRAAVTEPAQAAEVLPAAAALPSQA